MYASRCGNISAMKNSLALFAFSAGILRSTPIVFRCNIQDNEMRTIVSQQVVRDTTRLSGALCENEYGTYIGVIGAASAPFISVRPDHVTYGTGIHIAFQYDFAFGNAFISFEASESLTKTLVVTGGSGTGILAMASNRNSEEGAMLPDFNVHATNECGRFLTSTCGPAPFRFTYGMPFDITVHYEAFADNQRISNIDSYGGSNLIVTLGRHLISPDAVISEVSVLSDVPEISTWEQTGIILLLAALSVSRRTTPAARNLRSDGRRHAHPDSQSG